MSKHIPEDTIKAILDKADIVDVISEYVSLRQKGTRYWGRCPFHNEKTPSFSVTPDKNLYYCFGCHKGGNIVQFLMDYNNYTFVDAITDLADKTGIRIEYSERASEEDSKSLQLQELFNRVSKTFHYFLIDHKQGENALDYIQNRGFSNEVIEKFSLGFAPQDRNWLFNFLLKKNYSQDFLKESALFSSRFPRVSYFSNRLIFPIKDKRGNVIAFGGRLLEGEGPKYLNSPESILFKKRQTLYGLNLALETVRKNRSIIFVEGYLDVMALYTADISNVVAPLGTALTKEHVELVSRYIDTAYLLFDPDSAGINATLKSIPLFYEHDLSVEVITFPSKLDPADVLKKEGIEGLKKYIKCTKNSFEYLIAYIMDNYAINTIDGKQKALDFLKPFLIALQNSEVRLEAFINKIAENLQLNSETIHKYCFKGVQLKQAKQEFKIAQATKIEPTKDLFFVLTVVANMNVYPKVRNKIHVEDLVDPLARSLYIVLEDLYRKDEFYFDYFINNIDNDNVRNYIIKKINGGEFAVNAESIIEDAIMAIKERNVKKKLQEIQFQLRKAEKNGVDDQVLSNLLNEKIFFDNQLREIRKL